MDFVAATDQDVTEENTVRSLKANKIISSRGFWVVQMKGIAAVELPREHHGSSLLSVLKTFVKESQCASAGGNQRKRYRTNDDFVNLE